MDNLIPIFVYPRPKIYCFQYKICIKYEIDFIDYNVKDANYCYSYSIGFNNYTHTN